MIKQRTKIHYCVFHEKGTNMIKDIGNEKKLYFQENKFEFQTQRNCTNQKRNNNYFLYPGITFTGFTGSMGVDNGSRVADRCTVVADGMMGEDNGSVVVDDAFVGADE